jgi:hypothetical protein
VQTAWHGAREASAEIAIRSSLVCLPVSASRPTTKRSPGVPLMAGLKPMVSKGAGDKPFP